MTAVQEWEKRLVERRDLLEASRKRLAKAEDALEAARKADVHPRQQFVDAVTEEEEVHERRLAQVREAKAKLEAAKAKVQKNVRRPEESVRRSPNQSSRAGVKPRLIVLHSTEGAYDGSVSWLCTPAAQASANVVVARDARSTQLVPDEAKAWHVAADNPFTLGIEQEGYATQTDWPDAQLRKTAKYIAYWSVKFDIPIRFSTLSGVCRHSDLGAGGGGHHDPGAAYPLPHVLRLARGYAVNGW